MKEMLYDVNSFAIAGSLFVSMAVAIEIGYRLGNKPENQPSDSSKAQVSAIQSSLLGILALLLGFTFSQSLARYDARSNAVVEESNAIQAAFLKADLLPATQRQDAKAIIKQYVDLRVQSADVSTIEESERLAYVQRAKALQQELWRLASDTQNLPSTSASSTFSESVNKLIQIFTVRDSALNRHVPELVLFLLYGTFLMTGTIVGFVSGLGGARTTYSAYILVGLIVLLVFVIVDLDRPRRGLIEVDQSPMLSLQQEVSVYHRQQ